MAINFVDDIGAPLAVVAADLVIETIKPEWNEYASYVIAGGAYLANQMGWVRGDFVKNVGIAALPWAAKNLYNRVKGGVSSPVNRLTMRRVTRWPAPTYNPEFEGARLV